jgi:hypothetical protein
VLDLDLVAENRNMKMKDGVEAPSGWAVTYRCVLRLTIRDPEGQEVASFEDAATGTSPNLPTLGDAHDFACKVAVSMALKRAATNLGDGFGLSLYNKGQTSPLVIATLVMPGGDGKDVGDDVPAQVSMGHDDAGSTAPDERGPLTEDQWQAPVTDAKWAASFRERVTNCTSTGVLRGLYTELTEQVKIGKVAETDAIDLKALVEEVAETIKAAESAASAA